MERQVEHAPSDCFQEAGMSQLQQTPAFVQILVAIGLSLADGVQIQEQE